MNIAFFGSSDFAVQALDAILHSNHRVIYVVTAPDAPAGRGLKVQPTPVKLFALAHHLLIYQPERLTEQNFFDAIKYHNVDIGVVVSFRKIPSEIIALYPKRMINLHASYLPDYRGAAPIHWAIMNGEKFTGVSTFYLNDAIDEGNVILREKVAIDFHDTYGTLQEKLARVGSALLLKTLDLIEQDRVNAIPQSRLIELEKWQILHRAPKIYKNDCFIDWNKSATDIYNQVRGLCPEPSAFGILKHKELPALSIKLHQVQIVQLTEKLRPGEVLITKKHLFVGCGDSAAIEVLHLQPQAKRSMKSIDFINGLQVKDGWFFDLTRKESV